MKKHLDTIINLDQKGFLKGRYIGCNIRKTLDIMEYAESQEIAGLILSLDFEKAIDRIEYSAVEGALMS